MSLTTGTRLGPYEISAQIGVGGMGEVYRATDTNLARAVAIKVLPASMAADAERLARFDREAKTLAALNHPNIAAIYGLERSEGQTALVMELVEGPTLADRIRQGRLSLDEALPIARQITDALEAAHERGIVHRDLKPANIKLRPDGTVKVLDFGLAKAMEDPAEAGRYGGASISPTITSPAMTGVGVLLGTAAYMAPEQARGRTVDKRADNWAFGAVLYEMVAGRKAFDGEDVAETLAKVIQSEPRWDDVPHQVRRLLKSCLQKDPKHRLRDVGDAWQLLEDTPAPGAVTPARRSWQPWLLYGLALVAGVAMWWPSSQAPAALPDVKRFQIAQVSPSLGPPFTEFAVSPDGRYLVYFSYEQQSRSLRLHALDSLEGHTLPGTQTTQGAPRYPFWSPDSKFVAFATDGKLKKADIAGGLTQTVAEIDGNIAMCGSWNRDDVILIGGPTGIRRVSARGGSWSAVPGLRKGASMCPWFLPDGRHFLYLGGVTETKSDGVFVGSLDATGGEAPTTPLLQADAAVQFAPDSAGADIGYLVFRREQSLLAQRFDAARLQLMGDAVPLVDRVGSFFYFPFYSASANGILAFHPGPAAAARQLTWVDRQGQPIAKLATEPAGYSRVRLSPDGAHVAMTIADWAKVTSNVWMADAERGFATQITFGTGLSGSAAWSRDSKRFVYVSTDNKRSSIVERTTTGSGHERPLLTVDAPFMYPTSWSPDSRFILYDVNKPSESKRDIMVLPVDGSAKPYPFIDSSADEWDGQFSPGGQWVAYVSNEAGTGEVYVRPFSKSSGGKVRVSQGGALAPQWRGDGTELFYIRADGTLMAVDVSRSTSAEFQVGATTPLFKLAAVSSGSGAYNAAADGRRFLVGLPPTDAAKATRDETPFTVILNWTTLLRR